MVNIFENYFWLLSVTERIGLTMRPHLIGEMMLPQKPNSEVNNNIITVLFAS